MVTIMSDAIDELGFSARWAIATVHALALGAFGGKWALTLGVAVAAAVVALVVVAERREFRGRR